MDNSNKMITAEDFHHMYPEAVGYNAVGEDTNIYTSHGGALLAIVMPTKRTILCYNLLVSKLVKDLVLTGDWRIIDMWGFNSAS